MTERAFSMMKTGRYAMGGRYLAYAGPKGRV